MRRVDRAPQGLSPLDGRLDILGRRVSECRSRKEAEQGENHQKEGPSENDYSKRTTEDFPTWSTISIFNLTFATLPAGPFVHWDRVPR